MMERQQLQTNSHEQHPYAEGSNSTKKQVISPRKAVEHFIQQILKQMTKFDARLGYYSVVKKPTYNYYNQLGNQSQTPWQRQHRNLLRRSHHQNPKL